MKSVAYILLLAVTAVMLFPFLFMVATACKDEAQLAQPEMLPRGGWHFENFPNAWVKADFTDYLINSTVVGLATTLLTLLLASMAGFALSKYRFRGREVIFLAILSTLMVPPQVTMIPNFLTCSRIGLLDSLTGLVIPVLPLSFGIFLMRQFIRGVPDDLIAAARIDGATDLRIFFQLVLPLCIPALAALGVFTFMASWNGFLWPLIILDTPEKYTLPIGLMRFSQQFSVEQNHLMAVSILITLPVLILFVIFQRTFIRGLTVGGLSDEG